MCWSSRSTTTRPSSMFRHLWPKHSCGACRGGRLRSLVRTAPRAWQFGRTTGSRHISQCRTSTSTWRRPFLRVEHIGTACRRCRSGRPTPSLRRCSRSSTHAPERSVRDARRDFAGMVELATAVNVLAGRRARDGRQVARPARKAGPCSWSLLPSGRLVPVGADSELAAAIKAATSPNWAVPADAGRQSAARAERSDIAGTLRVSWSRTPRHLDRAGRAARVATARPRGAGAQLASRGAETMEPQAGSALAWGSGCAPEGIRTPHLLIRRRICAVQIGR